MTSINLQIPDSLVKTMNDIVIREGISVDQFVSLALAEKISAMNTETYLTERAKRGNKDAFLKAMNKVADIDPPDPRDRL